MASGCDDSRALAVPALPTAATIHASKGDTVLVTVHSYICIHAYTHYKCVCTCVHVGLTPSRLVPISVLNTPGHRARKRRLAPWPPHRYPRAHPLLGLYTKLPFPILYIYIAIQGGRGDTIYCAREWAMKAGSEVPKRRHGCKEYY